MYTRLFVYITKNIPTEAQNGFREAKINSNSGS
jgi:hypothetical protein